MQGRRAAIGDEHDRTHQFNKHDLLGRTAYIVHITRLVHSSLRNRIARFVPQQFEEARMFLPQVAGEVARRCVSQSVTLQYQKAYIRTRRRGVFKPFVSRIIIFFAPVHIVR